MKGFRILIIFSFIASTISAQRLHIGVFSGLSAYNGDLTDKYFPKKVTNGAIGITANYELKDQIMLRGGFTYTVVGGADRYSNNADLVVRNLSFETSITEFSVLGEYYLYNLYDRHFSPYIFGGLAVYHFNPYTFNGSNNKVFLKPLSTEGEGLPGYPGRRPYSLTQLALPFGGGVKYAINDNLRIGLELGLRKLFNDHLDDVSSLYADPNDLLAAKGQLAVDLSYRGDEVAGGNATYPSKGAMRGNSKYKDWYYFLGIHLTYRLGSGGGLFSGIRNKKLGCPTAPQ
jgi:opacity protein-like surface antigen